MTEQEFAEFVAAHEWTFAKTMAKIPHWYVVREKCRNDWEFEDAVRFVREHGEPRKFWRKTFVYYDYKGYSYWSMGFPLDETTILNRAENLNDPI